MGLYVVIILVIIEIYRVLSETQTALQLKEKHATHNIFTLKSVAQNETNTLFYLYV